MVNVGIIGAGFMGGMHAEVYNNLPNARVLAIADIDPEKCQMLASKYSNVEALTDPEKLFSREDIDTVDICLPTFLHKSYCIKAARAGKNIFCEKPITLSLKDADEIIGEVDKAGVKFMVGHVIRFWPEYVRLKEIVDSNKLGKLISITCTRLSPSPTWDWERWLTDSERSGGALVDLHIHDVDYLLYLLGTPVSLYSRLSNSPFAYGHVFTTFNFPDGVVGIAEGGWDMPDNFPFTMSFNALFEKGCVEFNNRFEKTLAIYEKGKKEIEYPKMDVEFQATADTGGNIANLGGYFSELKYFVNCIEKGEFPTLADGKVAREALRIVLLERDSINSGKIVYL